MIIGPYLYNCHSRKGTRAYWRCHNYSKRQSEQRCRARCVIANGRVRSMTGGEHNHGPHTAKIDKILARRGGVDDAQPSTSSSLSAAPPLVRYKSSPRVGAEHRPEEHDSPYDRQNTMIL